MRFGPQPGPFNVREKLERTKDLLANTASLRTILDIQIINRLGPAQLISVSVLLTFAIVILFSGWLLPSSGVDQSATQADTPMSLSQSDSAADSPSLAFDPPSTGTADGVAASSHGDTDSYVEANSSAPDPAPDQAAAPVSASATSSDGGSVAAEVSPSRDDSEALASRPSLSARSVREPEAPSKEPPAKPLSMEEMFIAQITEPSQATQFETGVPASVTMAQAILESDWGRSRLSREANNYFGIKATRKAGSAGLVYMDTWESINGRNVTLKEPFRAYYDMVESFVDHAIYFIENSRYAEAMRNVGDARVFARLIHKAGYATDPRYSDKLISLMDKFNLYAYDVKP